MASSTNASIIQLVPASAAFVDDRTTTLGTWVLAAFLDCTLMGVIFCQLTTFVAARRVERGTPSRLQKYYFMIVAVAAVLSILKTLQAIAIVWMQNVYYFANPDVARTLVATAWWQVTTPLTTGIIGCVVQSFFCTRFFLLCNNWMCCVPIVCAMCLGLAGGCMSVYSIVVGNTQAKIMWLMVHLFGVFVADTLITAGTIVALRRRALGLPRATQLLNRLLRMVFESAIPPTIIATMDLVLTQVLGAKLLWHLFANTALGKVYVISLLYTLNSIYEIRGLEESSGDRVRRHSHGINRRSQPLNDIELSPHTTATTKSGHVHALHSKNLSGTQARFSVEPEVDAHKSNEGSTESERYLGA